MFQSCAAVRLQAVAVRCHSVSAQLVPLLLEPCHPISLWLWPELDDLSDLLDISGCFVNWLLLFNGQQCSWDHRWSVATTIAEDQETLSVVHILQNLFEELLEIVLWPPKLGFREIFLKAMACVSDCRDFQFCLSWQHTRTVFAFGMTDQNSGRGRPPRISHGRTTVLRPTQTTPSLKALTAFLCMKRGLQLKDQGNLDP